MNPNSILAMLAEIEANPLRGLIEPEEKREALETIERILKGAGNGKAETETDISNRSGGPRAA